MTKILIEIDTDTQRVVPVSRLTVRELPPLYADEGRQEQVNSFHYYSGWNDLVSILTAAPQPEPVDVDLRRDAERYRWLNLTTGATGSGFHNYYLKLPIDWSRGSIAQHWEEAIDLAMSQGEQK